MPTIKDVAKEAGVSVATVSRVVNKSPKASNASILRVTSAMHKLGYRPNANARALVRKSSDTLGVLVADVADPFFGAMVKAIDNVAKEQGKQLLIGHGYHNADDERRALELLISSRCEAIIVHAKGLSDDELIAYAKEVPAIVIINRYIAEIASRCVSLDNQKGAFLATEYLVQQGHQHIACITSLRDIEDKSARLNGYFDALTHHNISLSSEYIAFGEPDYEGGEQAMQQLLQRAIPFSAVFTYNDNMAAGALAALDSHGILVPDDISLVGFDDGIIARLLRPRLTTVHYPIAIMANYAAKLALSQTHTIENTAPLYRYLSTQSIFYPTLVPRNSTRSFVKK